jgi:uncharacterized protein
MRRRGGGSRLVILFTGVKNRNNVNVSGRRWRRNSVNDPQGRGIDLDAVTAIDVHTHVHASVNGRSTTASSAEGAVAEVFGVERNPTVPDLAEFYRSQQMACVVFTVDTMGGDRPVSDEEIFEQAALHRDVVIPFASVDPRRGAEGVERARRLIERYDVRGFKFHPSLQEFFPDDRSVYPLYEVLAEHRLVALFHTGQTAVGSGRPGGGGIRLKYSHPMHLDEVAADFPDMPIIMAHPSVPWQDEALAVALHKPQVHIDLSGWLPKYFPPQLVQYANTLLKDKVLFGTDYPALTPRRWLASFDELPVKPEVRPKILKDNAARLFGLSGSGAV